MANKAYSEERVEQAKAIFETLLTVVKPRLDEREWDRDRIQVALAAMITVTEYVGMDENPSSRYMAEFSKDIAEVIRAAAIADLNDPRAACEAAGRWAFARDNEDGENLIAEMREKQFNARPDPDDPF